MLAASARGDKGALKGRGNLFWGGVAAQPRPWAGQGGSPQEGAARKGREEWGREAAAAAAYSMLPTCAALSFACSARPCARRW
jgi:hypothetical protein